MRRAFDYEVIDGYCVRVDCGQAGVEGYAMAFLKLSNVAREGGAIYKVETERDTNNILVYCRKKSLDNVKEFCNELCVKHDGTSTTIIGKVVDEWKMRFALIDYDFELLDDEDEEEFVGNDWIISKC